MNDVILETIERKSVQYHYSNDLKMLLQKVIGAMFSYYGQEYIPQILKVIEYYPITICQYDENIYTKLKEFGHINEEEEFEIVREGDLKRANGVASSNPIIKYENGQYVLEGFSSCIILSSTFDINHKTSVAILVHELSHALKSIDKNYQLHGNLLTTRSGISTETFELSNQQGQVTMKCINACSVGLEEGINSFDEEQIMCQMYHEPYETSSYLILRKISEIMFQKEGFLQMIRDAQINGNIYSFFQQYNEISGENAWELFSKLSDKLVTLFYQSIQYLFEPEKLEEVIRQEGEYLPQIQECLDSYRSQLQETNQK